MEQMIAPSILSSDFANLEKEITMLNNSEADWIHIDVMDGLFVPNLTIGFPVIRSTKKHAQKPLDVHLMIIEPERYLAQFRDAGADILSVHYEASIHLHRTIDEIKKLGMKAGVVLNPHTNVSVLNEIINEADLIVLMSVNPGYGGQKFIKNTYNKISTLKKLIREKESEAKIEIDGGVDISNASNLFQKGANNLVAGNTVFSSPDPSKMIAELKNQ
ncbi:MAG: ribulose-phosphate 3-epimerase [Bacteroidales bacterium]|nr:ribulose-phosphate 3-epimerase [Bacteroidales bacterium]